MHLSALLIEDFLEWAGLSIANFQPEKKTMWIWPHREWSLIFPPMNRKAGIKRVFWRRKYGQVEWPDVNPDTTGPLTLQPQHLEGVVLWLLGACPSDWLLLWGGEERGKEW